MKQEDKEFYEKEISDLRIKINRLEIESLKRDSKIKQSTNEKILLILYIIILLVISYFYSR